MPAHFREEVEGFPDPFLGRMLGELDGGGEDLQLQAKRHLEEDVGIILEPAAPGVEGTSGGSYGSSFKSIDRDRDVFALTDAELGRTSLVTHRIDTGDTGPIKIPPHRASPAKLPIIREEDPSML